MFRQVTEFELLGLLPASRDAGWTEAVSCRHVLPPNKHFLGKKKLRLTVRFPKQIANSNSDCLLLFVFFFCKSCFKRQLESFPIHRKEFHLTLCNFVIS